MRGSGEAGRPIVAEIQERIGIEQMCKGRVCTGMREERPRLSGGLLGHSRKAAAPSSVS